MIRNILDIFMVFITAQRRRNRYPTSQVTCPSAQWGPTLRLRIVH